MRLVRTMPWCEAEDMLFARRAEVLGRLCAADDSDKVDLGYILSALNMEIAAIHRKQDGAAWSRTVRAVCGEDLWAQCIQHKRALEADIKVEKENREKLRTV